MKMFIRDVLMLKDSDDLSIDLFGLNHMVFIKDVLVNGKLRFAELLDGVASGQLKASSVKNIFDLPFSEGLIRSLICCHVLICCITSSRKRCWLLKWANTTKAAHEHR